MPNIVLSPAQHEQLHRQLLLAFIDASSMHAFLIGMGHDFYQLSLSNADYRGNIRQLIRTAQAEDWLLDFVQRVRDHLPKDPVFRQLSDELKTASAPQPTASAADLPSEAHSLGDEWTTPASSPTVIPNVPTPPLPPGANESGDEHDTTPRKPLDVEDNINPRSPKTLQACKFVTGWIASTLVNNRIYFSRFQFNVAQGECTAEAFRLGMNDRAKVSVSISGQSNDEYTLIVTVSSSHRGTMLSRATRLQDVRFDEQVVIFLTRDLWPELVPSLDYLRNL
jgi:hypothetical protein